MQNNNSMTIEVTETFDSDEETGSFTLLITGSLDTISYTYANGVFTLAERTGEAVTSRADTVAAVQAIGLWFRNLRRRLHVEFVVDDNIDFVVKIKNKPGNKKTCSLDLDNDTLIDMEYNDGDWEATFQPRAEYALTPSQFCRFFKTLEQISHLLTYPTYS